MAKTFSTNENNDLYLGKDGNLAMSTGVQAVLQECENIVKVRLGEVVLDIDQGIPFFEVVWNGIPNVIQFESSVRAEILKVAGVLEIVSFSTKVVDKALSYEAVIKTIYGQGTISG